MLDIADKDSEVLIYDFRQRFWWGIKIRYGAVALVSVFFLFSLFSGEKWGGILPLFLLLAVYNFIAHAVYLIKKQFMLWEIVSLISFFLFLDIAAVTYLINITGWLESPYWFLYLVLIIISGFGYFSRYSAVVFLIAFFCVVFYLGQLLSVYFGILPVFKSSVLISQPEFLNSLYNKAIFTVASFFLFAATIYYFSQTLTLNRKMLSQKNRELLQALQEIQDISRLKDEFISNASHELRTPLSVIRENVSLIEDGLAGAINDKQKKLLGTARQNVDHITALLARILDVSLINERALEIKLETINLSELAKRAVTLLQDLADNKRVSLELGVPEKVQVKADPEQILQVFINLIDNAIKYNREEGKVKVSIEPGESEVRVAVEDSGIGIDKKELPLLFERFIRLKNADDLGIKGSGLGLYICRGIIELHGGKIWVESEQGKGAKFIFSLPRVGTYG
jgi:signal transduction histidine kinase